MQDDDLEHGKLLSPASAAVSKRPRRSWLRALPLRSQRLVWMGACVVLAGVARLAEVHTLLWYTMNCEYLSHRDARFVDRDNNYLCLTDAALASALRGLALTAAAVFEAHNITYFLESGTLLGAFRERGVIRHDTDVDLGIDARGLAYLQRHPVQLPDGYVLNVWNSPHFPGSTRDDKLPVRITHTATALYADVFVFLDWPAEETPWDEAAVGPLPSVCFKGCKACPLVDGFRHFTVPRAWVYPLVDCEMEGRTFKCPRESAKYLQHMYGNNYMTPS